MPLGEVHTFPTGAWEKGKTAALDWSAGTVEAASAEYRCLDSNLHAHHRVCCHVWFLMSYLPSKQDIMCHCADKYVLKWQTFTKRGHIMNNQIYLNYFEMIKEFDVLWNMVQCFQQSKNPLWSKKSIYLNQAEKKSLILIWFCLNLNV